MSPAVEPVHVPVLLDAVVAHLNLRRGAHCIDATIDGGGHAAAVLETSAPEGLLLGIDRDPQLLIALRTRFAAEIEGGRLKLANASFRDLGRIVADQQFPPADAVLFDLGVSSFHFDRSGRGFATMHDEPLDMRFDPADSDSPAAADILAQRSAEQLTALFRDYGEERFASRIARTIVARRRTEPLRTTSQLLDAVAASVPGKLRWRASRNAARVFQALRIEVNDELGAISEALPQAVAALAPGGRLAVISFHSLEDRLVKNFFRERQRDASLRIITKRPITPSEAEVQANPRAASAKLRVAERVSSRQG